MGIAVVLGLGGIVYAQQSKFQEKRQEDLDGYKTQLIDNCGSSKTLVLKFTVDPSFTKNSAAGQRDDLVVKLKKDIDK